MTMVPTHRFVGQVFRGWDLNTLGGGDGQAVLAIGVWDPDILNGRVQSW